MKKVLKFPNNFLWGAATSAYQIEGHNIWSDWEEFDPAGIACDHYSKFKEDFDWLERLNLNAYRLSIEWARIEKKEGVFDKEEIKHYREMLLNLKQRKIKVMLTLFHFTFPKWFAKKGRFEKKENLFYFRRFANKIFEEYKDLVDFWIIENEPLVYVGHSYFIGLWPPKKKSCFLAWRVLNNLVLLHKTIYQDFHKKDKSVKVGVAKNIQFTEPFSKKSVADRLSLWITDYLQNEYFLNKTKKFLDFIGLNYYFRCKIKFPFSVHYEGNLMSDIGWEIFPQGIYYVLKKLKKYRFPIYITENGVADQKDKLRKDFIKNHLYWIWKAINEGVKVKGYFHWSLIDNYEWLRDFKARFGLIEVELPSLQRKPRKSAFFYAEIAKNNYLIV